MKTKTLAAIFTLLPVLAPAGTVEDGMKAFVDGEVRAILADPAILSAITGANAANLLLTPADIKGLDDQWKAEVGKSGALVKAVSENAVSVMLRDYVYASGGKVTEIILMDAKGLNVAVSDITSDYWQGDEEKHSQTYGVGPDAIHVSEVEFDESTQTYQAQVSFTITDPATGSAIGAATIGLNAEYF